MSSTEACRLVGVSKRTGKVWRNGRSRLSGRNELPCLPYLHMEQGNRKTGRHNYVRKLNGFFLSMEERIRIADLLIQGSSVRGIAREIGYDPATVSREIRRHQDKSGAYNPFLAHQKSVQKLARPKLRKIQGNTLLGQYVQARLDLHWSPEQISRSLVKDFPYTKTMRLSHESIYQAIYVQGRGTLRRELKQVLRTGRAQRKPHKDPNKRRQRYRDPMVNISERPAEVADRAIPGHWEGDLIVGSHNASAIGTLVERTSRFCLLLYLPGDHTAVTVRDAIVAQMQSLPRTLRKSLTWDQGVELALHKKISQKLDMAVFFCDPHSPWQRGTNENTNGLLRQYFPKGTDLSVHPPEELKRVAQELNERPRKTLDWLTPAEKLNEILQAQ